MTEQRIPGPAEEMTIQQPRLLLRHPTLQARTLGRARKLGEVGRSGVGVGLTQTGWRRGGCWGEREVVQDTCGRRAAAETDTSHIVSPPHPDS